MNQADAIIQQLEAFRNAGLSGSITVHITDRQYKKVETRSIIPLDSARENVRPSTR